MATVHLLVFVSRTLGAFPVGTRSFVCLMPV
jgi:hypothetical protein